MKEPLDVVARRFACASRQAEALAKSADEAHAEWQRRLELSRGAMQELFRMERLLQEAAMEAP